MSRQFVTVAEEVHFIFPEGAGNLNRVKDEPAHKFFREYGESMPAGVWNDPGTKQGIYMIGPNAEYLEGGGAISGEADDMRRRLRTALERWKVLRKEKKYKNRRVPPTKNIAVPSVTGKPLALRVFLRDLPRGGADKSGRRVTKEDLRGIWPDFTQWAWNINWTSVEDPSALVPAGDDRQPVSNELFRRLCRDVLVDNVRGQTPRWRTEQVQLAELTMQRVATKRGRWVIEYQGRAAMDSGTLKYEPTLYGRGLWNPKKSRFEELEIVAIGNREGAGTFNQRGNDPGPAPMGVALILHRDE